MKAIQNKNIPVLLILLLLFSGAAIAQSEAIKSLNVGENVPDIDFQVDNYKDKTINFSQIKGKLIIIDLWATTCGGCIQAMPKMQRFQDIFGDQILIVLATRETKEKVQSVATKNENISNIKLPMIYGTDGLAGLFQYKWLPSHVWVDENGKIFYFSGSDLTTEENIRKYLNGEPIEIQVKQKNDISLSGNSSYQEQLIPYHRSTYGFSSFFTIHDPLKYNPPSSSNVKLIRHFPKSSHNTIQCVKATLGRLYTTAYNMRNVPMIFSRIVYEGNITNEMIEQEYHFEYSCDNTVNEDEFFRRARQNLDDYLGISSTIAQRPVKSLLLKKIPGQDKKMYSRKKDEEPKLYKNSYNNTVEITNIKLSDLTQEWRMFTSGMYAMKYPIFDDTGIDPDQPITFTMSLDWNDLEQVKQSLKPYGLTIEVVDKMMDCIVIYKK